MPSNIKNNTLSVSIREKWIDLIHSLQDRICGTLEATDGKAKFLEDRWERPEQGGGGKTRIIENGDVIEKGGVNTSVVHGAVSDAMRNQLKIDGSSWFACGLSLVIHPLNPNVPTVHANWRYFELYDLSGERIDSWFGGGTDLTPYYLYDEDAIHFHTVLKQTLDAFGTELYPRFKKDCDQYFANHHRNHESRGIGGIFYDYLRPVNEADAERLFNFQEANANAFLNAYLPIVKKEVNNFSEKKKSCGRKYAAGDMLNLI